jgi:hypothetical protein
MAVIMTGVLMTAVDTTIVVLALPEIQRGLHVALSAVESALRAGSIKTRTAK